MYQSVFFCESTSGFQEIKKEKLTPKIIGDRLKLVGDRLEENLKKAYDCKPSKQGKINGKDSELVLLDTMSKAKELNNKIKEIFKKKSSK